MKLARRTPARNYVEIWLSICLCLTGLIACDPPDRTPIYCAQHGGRYEMRRVQKDTYSGFCVFSDGTACAGYVFMNGQCKPGQTPYLPHLNMRWLVEELGTDGIVLAPNTQFWGGRFSFTALPEDKNYLLETSYERRPADILFIHVAQTEAEARMLSGQIQSYVDDLVAHAPSWTKDVGGPIRYYRCRDMVVVYSALQPPGIDAKFDATLAAKCGPPIAKYDPRP